MKTEHTTAAGSLRAVALAITVVSVVTFVAVGYSAYSDLNGVISVSRSGSSAVTAKEVTSGVSATLYVNASITNRGLLPLKVSLSCQSQPDLTCTPGSLTLAPGQDGVLRFQVTIANAMALANNPSVHINGTLSAELVPFAVLSVGMDLGSLLNGRGG